MMMPYDPFSNPTEMAKKTYIASSVLSFNVRLEGAKKHMSFSPLTLGGSMYTTSDERMQQAIERHRLFHSGAITILETIPLEKKTNVARPTKTAGEAAARYGDTVFSVAGTEGKKKAVVLEFSSLAEGKDYMADTYGVSRTKLRTRADIEKAAKENGVAIKWK